MVDKNTGFVDSKGRKIVEGGKGALYAITARGTKVRFYPKPGELRRRSNVNANANARLPKSSPKATGKDTNTGLRDDKGRRIVRGPMGGLYVLNPGGKKTRYVGRPVDGAGPSRPVAEDLGLNAKGRKILRGPRGGLYVLVDGKRTRPAKTSREMVPGGGGGEGRGGGGRKGKDKWGVGAKKNDAEKPDKKKKKSSPVGVVSKSTPVAELPGNHRTPRFGSPRNVRTRFGPFELQPHQIAVSRLFSRSATRGLLLFFKVGSGKTLSSIAAYENARRGDERAIVVTPASLVANYVKEIEAAGVDASRYTVTSFNKIHGMKTDEAKKDFGRDAIVIIDEAQNLRTPDSLMLASMLQLTKRAKKVLLLSGTPVMNYPMDIGGMLGLMNPANVPKTVGTAVLKKGKVAYKPLTFARNYGRDASKKTEELWGMLRCACLFYAPDAAAVKEYYPSKTERWVAVPMDVRQVQAQFALATDMPGYADIGALLATDKFNPAFLTKPRMVNSRVADIHPKIDAIVERVAAETSEGGKCVIFSTYLAAGLHRIKDLLVARGVDSEIYEGAASMKDKKRIVGEYNSGRLRVLLLSDAGKEGLDLKNTTQVHVLEPAWNEEKIAQVIGRAVRYKSHTGSKRHVDVFRYFAVFPNRRVAIPEGFERDQSVLFQMSADEILKAMADKKNEVNQKFLDKLVKLSDSNLRKCI